MSDDPVRLRIQHTTHPGCAADLHMPRWRAELIVLTALDRYWPDYEFSIEPWRPTDCTSPPEGSRVLTLAFWLGIAEAILGFVKSHLWIIWPALLLGHAIAAIYLPTAHLRVYPTVGLAVLSLALGYLGSKAFPAP